jgi:cytochrome bd-type quinol oxidase subunit 2
MPAKGQDIAMQTSRYLAKLIGPLFVAIGLGLLVNPSQFRGMAEQFVQSYPLIFISGLLALPAGLAIVLAHNVWAGDWRVIITVLGWLGVIGGALRIIFPQLVVSIGTAMFSHPATPVIAGIAVLALGGVLGYFGYRTANS